jgi:hypothetical protein
MIKNMVSYGKKLFQNVHQIRGEIAWNTTKDWMRYMGNTSTKNIPPIITSLAQSESESNDALSDSLSPFVFHLCNSFRK